MEELSENLIELGYIYHYPQPGRSMAPFQLEMFLVDKPTEPYHRLKSIHLPVQSKDNEIEQLSLYHLAKAPSRRYHVLAGGMALYNWQDEIETAFTFGGELEISVSGVATVCRLTSGAPILAFKDASPSRKLLIEEMEILLAARKAAQQNEPDVYAHRLIEADPLSLYWALTHALVEKINQPQYQREEDYAHLLWLLRAEEQRLKQLGFRKPLTPDIESTL